ncbi:MAG TPA: hypothetical protein VIG99_28640 [Myxococcaceae bacterium]|jgi:alpha-tubulin suppressor-like RCC1 family protein
MSIRSVLVALAVLVAGCHLLLDPGGEPVPAPSARTELAAGGEHTCAVVDGRILCWGRNQFGQLGSGVTADSPAPVQVAGLGEDGQSVAAGISHTCAVAGGRTLCWGFNNKGELGNGTAVASDRPVRVSGSDAVPESIAGGQFHSCRVLNGEVQCWGENQYCELGGAMVCDPGAFLDEPAQVGGLSGAQSVVTGDNHSCALVDGGVLCWGRGDYGQLGSGTTLGQPVPVPVAISGGVQAIAAGGHHTCAISGGSVWCWGLNKDGELGNGARGGGSAPAKIASLSGAVAIAAGSSHSCAITGGGVLCWGLNDIGQLGNGDAGAWSGVPVPVTGLDPGPRTVAAGRRHTCAAVDTGIQCWGANDAGQLGDSLSASGLLPVHVALP